MKINAVKYFLLLILLFNCNSDKIEITDEMRSLSEDISLMIDAFYLDNSKLPLSLNDLSNYYSNTLDINKLNSLKNNEVIKYIPLNIYSNKAEYYLIATKKNKKEIENNKEDFFSKLKSICEYETEKKGYVILNYNSTYLISKNRVTFDFEKSQTPYWRKKMFFNISLDLDSSDITISDNELKFIANIDSVNINGEFFDMETKENILDRIRHGEKLNLQGLKIKDSLSEGVRLIDVTINHSNRKKIIGKYYDAHGESKTLPNLRGCNDNIEN